MDNQTRHPGYYWVKYEGKYIAALYFQDGDYWEFPGMDNTFFSRQFSEISETRIPSPDELKAISETTTEIPFGASGISKEINDFVEANPLLYDIFFKYFRANE